MGWAKWEKNGERILRSPILREPFYIFTLILLSLLLPLSFLLLARLSNTQYLLTFTPYPPPPASFVLSFLLYTNPTLLHSLLSFVSVTALVHVLTGRLTIRYGSTTPILRPRLYTAWILLCTLQVCVGIGIEGTIAAGNWPLDYHVENRGLLLSRIIFFIGLHETMLHWSRTIVRPVVDDTVFGFVRDERLVERVLMAACFGALWWWKLRDEVETLAVLVEVKRDLLMGLRMADLVSWWLYYLTVTIGIVRLVRGLIWIGKVLLCRRLQGSPGFSCGDDDKV